MIKKIILIFISILFFTIFNINNINAQSWQWATSAGGINNENAKSMVTDAWGNIYITGAFNSPTLSFGSTTLTNAGGYDLYIVKYNAVGNIIWAKSAGGASDDVSNSISTDLNGNIYITGGFSSPTLPFGITALSHLGFGSNVFLAKYDSSGNAIWAKSTGLLDEYAYSVKTDLQNNVLITGYFSGAITFGTTTLTSNGASDIFLTKYDSSGNVIWAKDAGGGGSEISYSIEIDPNNNIYISGKNFSDSSMTFDTITVLPVGSFGYDIFLAKYNTSGSILWAKRLDGSIENNLQSIISDVSGNIYLTATTVSTLTFGATILTNAGGNDVFIVKYDSIGNFLWAKGAGGSNYDNPTAIIRDANGVLLTGNFNSPTIIFGSTTLTNAGGDDIFIVKYDSIGNVLMAKSVGGVGNDNANSLSTDNTGNSYLFGTYNSSLLTFGATTLANNGSNDIFLAKLSDTCSTLPFAGAIIGATNVCSGSTITLTDVIGGGIWGAVNSRALVSASGIITGVIAGVDTISYSVSNNCVTSSVYSYITIVGSVSLISTIAGNGTNGFSGDSIIGTSSEINNAYGVATDTFGNIYIADAGNNRIRKINSSGIISTIAGTGIGGFSGDGGVATAAKLNSPQAVATDDSGNIYISDSYNRRIRKINTSGIITTIAGNGTTGYSGDGGPALSAEFYLPQGIAVDKFGNCYIADYNNARIRKRNSAGIISTITGNGISGYSGDGGPATAATVDHPWGVAIDNMGNLYIGDSYNNCIRVINAAGVIKTYAGTGAAGFSGDGIAAISANLQAPSGICVDTIGNLFIADVLNNRIRKVDGAGVITTIAGNGLAGFFGDGGPATACEFKNPNSVAIDNNGNIFVADVLNSRIRKVLPSNNASIGGATTLCLGSTTTLNHGFMTGTWLATNSHVSISDSGVITAVSLGVDTINYTYSDVCGTTTLSKVVTIIPLPNAGTITGLNTICTGSTLTLTDTITGGTWSLTNTVNASITGTGIIIGMSAGKDTVNFSVSNSCGTVSATKIISINPVLTAGPISGPTILCVGANITLSEAVSGGSWIVSNGHASITGDVVTGSSFGVDTILYYLSNICGTSVATTVISVNTIPYVDSIYGLRNVCLGSSISLTESIIGGTWSSFNTSIVSVSDSGIAIGTEVGLSIISYTLTNYCGTTSKTASITVNPIPFAINGPFIACIGIPTTLSDSTLGGSWVSGATSIAVVNDSGILTGISIGTATISYMLGSTGCMVTKTIEFTPLPNTGVITGLDSVCLGATITLIDTTLGGTWSVSTGNAGISTILYGSIITGLIAGTDSIHYSVIGGCGIGSQSKIITIKPYPNPGVITGVPIVCLGDSVLFLQSVTGGNWSSTYSNATVNSTGMVYGINTGIDTIKYTVTNSCGSTTATKSISVSALPTVAVISGLSSVCAGSSITMFDGISGGIWSASNSNAIISNPSGVVTGIYPGTDIISYTVTNICGSINAIKVITINPLPDGGLITGLSYICVGDSFLLTESATGGVWSRVNTTVSVSIIGEVKGIHGGNDTLYYTVTNVCGTASAIFTITIIPLPMAGTIVGDSNFCIGTSTTLIDTTSGGTWSIANSNATVVDGVVNCLNHGIDTIFYTGSNVCGSVVANHIITINPMPDAGLIIGLNTVCISNTSTLNETLNGGVWSISNIHASILDSIVTGITVGVDTVTYTFTNFCGMANTTHTITINTLPNPGTITGIDSFCIGSSTTLTDTTAGGIWGTIFGTVMVTDGVVTSVLTGKDTITYGIANGCGIATAKFPVLVRTIPTSSITGFNYACVGKNSSLFGNPTGGTWSETPGLVTINSSGIVTGIAPGIDTITYTVTNFCGSTQSTQTLNVYSAHVCDSINEVKQIFSEQDIKVYPNPNNGTFVIELPENESNTTILIFDLLGNIILTENYLVNNKNRYQININNVSRGTYLLKIMTDNIIYRKQIVIW